MAYTEGQAKCIETLDRSLVVAAGAGSGKTFTLTKRIVRAIDSGAVEGIDRVCAITFTNKAAAELKSRIKAELRACGLMEQALAVDEAWVSTIHGMCARILRAHALELDLDPMFKMADAADASAMRDRAVESVLLVARDADTDFERGERAFGRLPLPGDRRSRRTFPEQTLGVTQEAIDALFAEYPARAGGPRSTSVETMLGTLMGMASASPLGFDRLVAERSRLNPAALLDQVVQVFEALVEETLAQNPTEAREAWAARASERLASIRSDMGGHADDVVWALHALDGLPLPKRTGTAGYRAQVGEALGIFNLCVMELRLAAAAPHLETLVALARAASGLYAQLKRAAGVLDNDDLLVGAYRAVSTRPEIAALYADRFQLVMVDEFQDTDQMQVDMIKMLAGPGARRLCTVGDAQQSIYRFRGADVSVYRRHLDEVRAANPDDIILLPDNFRSHADVLALVDRVFERPEMFGGEFMSLAPGRDEARVKRPFAKGLPRVQVQLTTGPYRGVPTAELRETAAARIADAFAEAHAEGHSAGEMAILLGAMTYADVYARALRERGLACVVSGGSVFADAPETRLVLALVRVAANPGQTEELMNVLESDLFALTAGDFLELATYEDESGEPRRGALDRGLAAASRRLADGERGAAPPEWSERLATAVRVMGDLLAGAGRSRVSRLVERVLVESGWLSRLEAAGPEGLSRAANAYKAVRIVRGVEEAQAAGPAHVARLFEALLEGSKEAPGALSATGGDFVRIMTVHASKGLEFPLVAVAEMRDSSGPSDRLVAGDVKGRVYLSLDLGNTVAGFEGAANVKGLPDLYASFTETCADETDYLRAIEHADGPLARRAALYGRECSGDAEEAKRLLYVALTRAKEALVVSLFGKRTKGNPNGTPTSVLGEVVRALAGEEGLAPGVSQLDFRGSASAFAEHVALEPGGADGVAADGDAAREARLDGEAAGEGGLCPSAASAREDARAGDALPTFAIPSPEERPPVHRVPYAPARDGVSSYSSIAEAVKGNDLVGRLAARFFVSADVGGEEGACAPDGDDGAASAGDVFADHASALSDFPYAAWHAARNAAVVDEDDGSWAYVGVPAVDADRATDLGCAFHRLAQAAVVARAGRGPLACPDATRVASLARSCKLDGLQRARLDAALARWFASEAAAEAAGLADLRAEVPFFVGVPATGEAVAGEGAPGFAVAPADAETGASASFLEGEIDLLGYDRDRGRALVVDYKTGGSDDETAGQLARKHVLQASCYAYAVMLQGARSVDAVFVRVERPQAADADQPQCVRYRFDSGDLPLLTQAVSEALALGG